VNVSDIWKI